MLKFMLCTREMLKEDIQCRSRWVVREDLSRVRSEELQNTIRQNRTVRGPTPATTMKIYAAKSRKIDSLAIYLYVNAITLAPHLVLVR